MIPAHVKSGSLVTIAGTGEPGFSGDGGPATAACLSEPKNLAFDREGNLYIADSENHCIRRVDRHTGIITTVAGSPHEREPAPVRGIPTRPESADQEDDPLGELGESPVGLFSQTADLSGTVRYTMGGKGRLAERYVGDDGPALRACLNFPSAVVVEDHVALYIADMLNHRIRRVDLTTGIMTTLAGTGQAKWKGDNGPAVAAALNEPVALALDASHDSLYVADQSNNRVRRIALTTGMISTIAGTGEACYSGDGPAQEVGLAGPSGLALDLEGNLYIADTFNERIRKWDRERGLLSTVLGDGSQFRFEPGAAENSLSLARPYGIAVDRDGRVWITDSDNHLLRRWDPHTSTISVVAGNGYAGFAGDEGPAEEASLNYPFGVAIDPWGNIAIADTFNHRIRLIVAA